MVVGWVAQVKPPIIRGCIEELELQALDVRAGVVPWLGMEDGLSWRRDLVREDG